MGYQKSIRGNDNESNEQLSNNKVTVHVHGAAPAILVSFIILLLCAALGWLVLNYGGLLCLLCLVTLLVLFAGGTWLFGVLIYSKTGILLAERSHAVIAASVAVATDHYILWREDDGTHQFRGSTIITENRQFLPKEIAPPSQQEAILTCYDEGMSGRAIEKWLKDNGTKVPYREIAKTLDLYRPDWNKKVTVKSDTATDDA